MTINHSHWHKGYVFMKTKCQTPSFINDFFWTLQWITKCSEKRLKCPFHEMWLTDNVKLLQHINNLFHNALSRFLSRFVNDFSDCFNELLNVLRNPLSVSSIKCDWWIMSNCSAINIQAELAPFTLLKLSLVWLWNCANMSWHVYIIGIKDWFWLSWVAETC